MAKSFRPPFPGFGTPMPNATGNPFTKNSKKAKPPKKGKKKGK